MAAKEEQLNQVLRQQRDRLLQLTNLSPEQAKEMLLRRIEDDCKLEAGAIIQRITEQAQEEAKEKSRQIILQAIQRYAAEQTADHTVSTVNIPTRRHEGPRDRPRRAEHPQLREGDRGGCDHRRYAGRGGGELFRSGAARSGQAVAGSAGAGWTNPSGPDRGSRRGDDARKWKRN